MRRATAFAVAVVATFAPVVLPAATGAGVACAATTPHAGLVIDTGSRTLELCVELDAARVSGLHLVELAGDQYGLQYGFGLGGQGMCRLDGTGPTGDDCFADYPDFWGFWKGDGSGAWTWAPTGPASSTVGNGELDGWVWGAGDTGNTHAKPPAVSIDAVCPPEASPTPAPQPSATHAPSPTPEPSPDLAGSPSAGPDPRSSATSVPPPTAAPSADASRSPESTQASRSPVATGSRITTTSPVPTAARSTAVLAEAPNDGEGGNGPNRSLAFALTLATIFALGGWFRLRANRRAPEP
jgi:hypothetical protein